MGKESAYDIVDRADFAFHLTILGGSIGTGEAESHTIVTAKFMEGVVFILSTIVTL